MASRDWGLVLHAFRWIIKAGLSNNVTIHCTFLDAYDGVIGEKAYEYGTHADWADSYFARHAFQQNGWTGRILPNAYNIDVTALDPNVTTNQGPYTQGPPCNVLEADHGWPTVFYSNSIVGNLSSVSNGSYYNNFGFPLSEETGGWKFATNQYPVGNGVLYGSVTNLGPENGTCIPPYALPPGYIATVPSFSTESTIQSTTGSLQTSSGYAQVGTGSPVWLATVITDTNALNYVSLDAGFTSALGADGLLTVYWDTDLIGEVDEAAVQPALQHYNFSFPNSHVNTGRRDNATPPHRGEGCGDTLNDRAFLKESSSLRQKTPPSRISSGKIVSAAHGEVGFSQ